MSVDDNFLIQVFKEPTRKGALLDLILANKAELVVDVKVRGRLSCTDHEMMQFKILSGGSRAKSGVLSLLQIPPGLNKAGDEVAEN